MSRLMFDAILEEERAFTVDAGTNEPWGLLTRLDATSATESTPTKDGTFTVADMYKVAGQLPPRFLSNSS